MEIYWNDTAVFIRYQVPVEIDILDFRISPIANKINDILTNNRLTFEYSSVFETLDDTIGMELKFIKNEA